jgi:valyl-tRNA synthetase
MWHRFADVYIEEFKEDLKNGVPESYDALEKVYLSGLKLLHPFIPFVTDAVHKSFKDSYILENNTV